MASDQVNSKLLQEDPGTKQVKLQHSESCPKKKKKACGGIDKHIF